MAERQKKSPALDKEICDLELLLNEKVTQKAQLDRVLAKCSAKKKGEAKTWVAQSKTIISTLEIRKSEYLAAITTKKIYENNWPSFKTALNDPRLS